MKQTIAELGKGGEGWIIYNDLILPKRVVHIEVVGNWGKNEKLKTLIPEYVLREHIESNKVQTTQDLIVFGNEIVYSTKEEAEEELKKEVGNTFTHIEQKSVDWEKALKDLALLKGEYDNTSKELKEDLATLSKKLKNIANPQPNNIDWKQVRINASISILNSLLETTKHSVLEEVVVNEIYAKTAIAYADSLVKELKRSEAFFEEELKKI